MHDLEGVLGPDMIRFVDANVRSLLTWDILVFFHKNPEAVVDIQGLASRLGRRAEDIEPEIAPLCESGILQCAGGLARYKPSPDMRDAVSCFVDACADKGRRLALIALVLHNINPRPQSQPPASV